MSSKLGIIIGREFRERVAKKSFIITTLLMPIIMLLMMAIPALLAEFYTPSDKTFAVADRSGIAMKALQEGGFDNVKFVAVSNPEKEVNNDDYDGVLDISDKLVADPANSVKLYLHDAGQIMVESQIRNTLSQAVEQERLKNYDIPNLDKILDEVKADVNVNTIRIDELGEESTTSSMLSYMLGIAMAFILYMFLLLYGQMVMSSIIEEKNNRVLELVVTNVRPIDLMLGKIFGVALVAVLQIVIWGVIMCLLTSLLLPAILPETVSNEVAMMNAGTLDLATATTDTDLLSAISILGSVAYIMKLFIYLALFLVGGFLFYAAIFAAIGSAVDSVQDASQLTSFATIPIIIGLLIGLVAAQDPNGQLAIWTSIIPFTSPMVMLIRIPFEVPAWQIWVSLAILYLSFVGMTWVAAKIYRIGIFMHGKKPSIKDLYRWATYK
jgi:ABC-2 type transport system permease protein